MLGYSAAGLRSMDTLDSIVDVVSRPVRKILFKLRLWNLFHRNLITSSECLHRSITDMNESCTTSSAASYSVNHDDSASNSHDANTIATGKAMNNSHLKFSLINIQSINNKTDVVSNIISDNNIDILALTETWHMMI